MSWSRFWLTNQIKPINSHNLRAFTFRSRSPSQHFFGDRTESITKIWDLMRFLPWKLVFVVEKLQEFASNCCVQRMDFHCVAGMKMEFSMECSTKSGLSLWEKQETMAFYIWEIIFIVTHRVVHPIHFESNEMRCSLIGRRQISVLYSKCETMLIVLWSSGDV